MKKILFLFLLASLLYSCSKDPAAPNPDTTPKDSVNVYVPIYEPGDTSLGAAYGKKLNIVWTAQTLCTVLEHYDTNYVGISLLTYSPAGYLRESMSFGPLPRFEKTGVYEVKTMLGSNVDHRFLNCIYGTFASDGDLSEDIYYVDTSATDNLFRVTNLDWENRTCECSFTVTYKLREPRVNPKNPMMVKFTEGKAWAVIRE